MIEAGTFPAFFMAVEGDKAAVSHCGDLNCGSGLQRYSRPGTSAAKPGQLRQGGDEFHRQTALQRRAYGWDGSRPNAERRPGRRPGDDPHPNRAKRWSRKSELPVRADSC